MLVAWSLTMGRTRHWFMFPAIISIRRWKSNAGSRRPHGTVVVSIIAKRPTQKPRMATKLAGFDIVWRFRRLCFRAGWVHAAFCPNSSSAVVHWLGPCAPAECSVDAARTFYPYCFAPWIVFILQAYLVGLVVIMIGGSVIAPMSWSSWPR